MIFHFNIRRKVSVIRCDTCFFSVWLRTGSNPADINRFRSHTGKLIIFRVYPSVGYGWVVAYRFLKFYHPRKADYITNNYFPFNMSFIYPTKCIFPRKLQFFCFSWNRKHRGQHNHQIRDPQRRPDNPQRAHCVAVSPRRVCHHQQHSIYPRGVRRGCGHGAATCVQRWRGHGAAQENVAVQSRGRK